MKTVNNNHENVKFKSVNVKFKNAKYNYTTSVNPQISDEEIQKYFIGTAFNVGSFPEEIFETCTSVEIY